MLKFELSLEEANVVFSALRKVALPFEVTAPLIEKFQKQAQEQLQKEETKSEEKPLKKSK